MKEKGRGETVQEQKGERGPARSTGREREGRRSSRRAAGALHLSLAFVDPRDGPMTAPVFHRRIPAPLPRAHQTCPRGRVPDPHGRVLAPRRDHGSPAPACLAHHHVQPQDGVRVPRQRHVCPQRVQPVHAHCSGGRGGRPALRRQGVGWEELSSAVGRVHALGRLATPRHPSHQSQSWSPQPRALAPVGLPRRPPLLSRTSTPAARP